MTPDPISLTITTRTDPPLDVDTAPAIGEEIAARLGVEHALTAYDIADLAGGAAVVSWTLAVPNDRTVGAWSRAAEDAVRSSVPAGHALTLTGLELVATEEVERRLAARGVPAPGAVPASGRELPAFPRVLTTAEFAALLGVSTARVRQLRKERAKADEEGVPHPFPAPYPGTGPLGLWLEEDARRYAALPRPAGRPPRDR